MQYGGPDHYECLQGACDENLRFMETDKDLKVGICAYKCSTPFLYFNEGTMECLELCPDKVYYKNGLNRECASAGNCAPTGERKVADGNGQYVCLLDCPEGQVELMNHTCGNSCADKEIAVLEDNKCKAQCSSDDD